MKKSILRQIVIGTLTLQMVLPTHMSWAQSTSVQNEPLAPDLAVSQFIEGLAEGKNQSLPIKSADVFSLLNQRVEVESSQGVIFYDLNKINPELPTIAFTSLKINYDSTKKELVFEAQRGADKSGENGVTVARHIISNIDLANYSKDAEFLQFVDKNGSMHVIDMGLVATQILKSPIPVFKNIWTPLSSEKGVAYKVGFLTRGTTPFPITENTLVMRNEKGEVQLHAGDFYILKTKPDGSVEPVGIFSREVTYEAIYRGLKTLEYESALVSNDTEIMLKAEKAIEALQEKMDSIENSVGREKISPQVKAVLSAINPESLAHLMSRSTQVKGLQSRDFDQFTTEEWIKSFHEIKTSMGDRFESQAAELSWMKEIPKREFKTLTKVDEIQGLRKSIQRIKNKFSSKNSMNFLVGFLAAGTAAYFSFPYVHDYLLTQEQIKTISFAYENFYPDVLKDASYRSTLLLSMASLAAIWPEAVGFSALIGKQFNLMAEKMKNQTTKTAVFIKDLSKNWGSLSNWQRITSFGMRLYAWLILPYWRVTVQYLLQQKVFFAATTNDLNPFGKINANSEIGRKLGLTKDEYIGLNRIYGAAKESDIKRKLEIQGAMIEQDKKVKSTALLVAATLVAQKYNTDPALVAQVLTSSEAAADIKDLIKVLDTKEKQSEWELLTDLILKESRNLRKKSIVIDQHMSDVISEMFKVGSERIEEISRMNDWKLKLNLKKIRFAKKANLLLKEAANFGKVDHEFLKKVFTSDFVSSQVQKEFTVDHLMVVGIVALYGERADLSHPDHLSAEAKGFLWTSNAHWFDMFMNTYMHFFVAGAQTALVLQKVKPQQATGYAPVENYIFQPAERVQSLGSASKEFIKDIANPLKADLGGVILKRFVKRFTTLTAGLTMMFVLRVGVWNQPITDAMLAWSLSFFAATWFYGWIWDPVQKGNQLEEERIEAKIEKLKDVIREINSGDLEKGRKDLIELYKNGNPEVLKSKDLGTMNKDQLIAVAMIEPPVYTKANPMLSWITTWIAAAGSTVLAIPLSVILMDPNLLHSSIYETWMLRSVGLYAATYALLSKNAWEFYLEKWDQVKAKYKSWKEAKVTRNQDKSELKTSAVLNLMCSKALSN